MKSKAKIDKLAHKYALDISKFHEKGETKIDFNNLNKDFYDDIETNDIMINKDKKLLNKLKNNTIKEFIYSNKIIPNRWKNKFNYQYKLTSLISKDKKLLSYIGSSPNNNKNNNNQLLPKINTNHNIINTLNNKKNLKEKNKRTFQFKQREELDKDDLKIIMNDYESVFPIKNKFQTLMEEYSTELSNFNNIFNNNNNFNDKSKINDNNEIDSSIKNNSQKESNFISYIRKINPLNKKERTKIQNTFRHNIINLDSLKHHSQRNIHENDKSNLFNININKKRKINYKNKSGIKNKIIERNLENINFYGPHCSFCPSCKTKNLEFYNYMEPNQCLELINHIKNYRKANNIYSQRNSTNTTNTLNKNKRSASVPKLSIFNEKDSEYSEKEDNTFKIDF